MSQPYNPEDETRGRLSALGALSGRSRWVLLGLLLLLIGLGLYTWLQPTTSLSTAFVTVGNIKASVTANARARATRTARLSFPVSGKLVKVLVQEGDAVKKGAVLAELQSDDFDRRVQQAQLNLASRQLELDRAQAPPRVEDLQVAQSNVKKAALALAVAEDNDKKNPTTANDAAKEAAQADYDTARANFDRLTNGPTAAELNLLKNAVALAQIELQSAQAARAQTQISAPYDAIVTEVDAQPEELVGGFNPVVAIADTSQLELLAEIDEIDVGAVAEGQSVEVRFDAFPGQTLSGRVTEVFPAASTERGALVYHARIQFERGDLAIRPGMGATVKIATVEKKNVLLVPSRAVRDAGTRKIVAEWLNGVITDVVVETGLTDGNQTEIVSGLQRGARVVIE